MMQQQQQTENILFGCFSFCFSAKQIVSPLEWTVLCIQVVLACFFFLCVKYVVNDLKWHPMSFLALTSSCTWFEHVSMLVILLNCVTLGMFQPCEDVSCQSEWCRILQVSVTLSPLKLGPWAHENTRLTFTLFASLLSITADLNKDRYCAMWAQCVRFYISILVCSFT